MHTPFLFSSFTYNIIHFGKIIDTQASSSILAGKILLVSLEQKPKMFTCR